MFQKPLDLNASAYQNICSIILNMHIQLINTFFISLYTDQPIKHMPEVLFATVNAVTVDMHQLLTCLVQGFDNQNIRFFEETG